MSDTLAWTADAAERCCHAIHIRMQALAHGFVYALARRQGWNMFGGAARHGGRTETLREERILMGVIRNGVWCTTHGGDLLRDVPEAEEQTGMSVRRCVDARKQCKDPPK